MNLDTVTQQESKSKHKSQRSTQSHSQKSYKNKILSY